MLSRDKRATLSSGLLAGKGGTPQDADDRARVARARSQSELARSVIKEIRDSAKTEKAEEPARDAVLYSKGAASASGFRPWYWSYERDGSPQQSDSAGTVTPFPAGTPSPVSPPDPVSAPATVSAALRSKSAVRLMLVLGAVAVVGSASFLLLERRPSESAPVHPAAPVAAAPLPAELPAPVPVVPPPQVPAPPQSVAPESVTPPPIEHAPALSAEEIAELMRRGDDLLATGDIIAARRFYERAAEAGSAPAATAAGKTYDPLFLREAHARGLAGDPVKAARWYRKASEGGDRNADALMRRLMAKYSG